MNMTDIMAAIYRNNDTTEDTEAATTAAPVDTDEPEYIDTDDVMDCNTDCDTDDDSNDSNSNDDKWAGLPPLPDLALCSRATVIANVMVKKLKNMPVTADEIMDRAQCAVVISTILTMLDDEREHNIYTMTRALQLHRAMDAKAARRKAERCIDPFKDLPNLIIAHILCKSGLVKMLHTGRGYTDNDLTMITRVYMRGVPTIWREINKNGCGEEINALIGRLAPEKKKADKAEIIVACCDFAEIVEPNISDRVIYAGNGVIDARGKKFDEATGLQALEFTPYDSPDFEAKYGDMYPIRYNTNVEYHEQTAPVICHCDEDGTDWEVISGIKELFEDNDKYSARLVLETAQFGVRGINGGYTWLWMNTMGAAGGGNGKGTASSLISNLIGPENISSVSIHDMGADRFAIQDIIGKAAIISSETRGMDGPAFPVDRYKLLSRQEKPINIPRKFLPDLNYLWRGIMIQEMNGDKINPEDKTESFWRTILVIKFEKSFAQDAGKRDYIKFDYAERKDVLEYLLWYIVRKMPWLTAYDKEAAQFAINNRKTIESNGKPVQDFLNEILLEEDGENDGVDTAKWNKEAIESLRTNNLKRIPAKYLYGLYGGWAAENGIKNVPQYTNFKTELKNWVAKHRDKWDYNDKDKFAISEKDGRDMRQEALARYGRNSKFGINHSEHVWNEKYLQDPYHLTKFDATRLYLCGIYAPGHSFGRGSTL